MKKSFFIPYVSLMLVVGLFNLSFAQAEMISAMQSLSQMSSDAQRSRVINFMRQPSTQKQLEAWGVDCEEAQQRINHLSDKEIARISGHLDQLPAGQDGVGALIGAALFVFLVLLITDILGFTDVFQFVKKRAH